MLFAPERLDIGGNCAHPEMPSALDFFFMEKE
jgi:hypothetical protein